MTTMQSYGGVEKIQHYYGGVEKIQQCYGEWRKYSSLIGSGENTAVLWRSAENTAVLWGNGGNTTDILYFGIKCWPSVRLRLRIICSIFFFCGAATQRGSWPPHSWGFLDHTQRCTTVGTTPLNEWSARHRDLYLTTHNTHNRETPMPPVGFEPTISADERLQTYSLDRAATGTGNLQHYITKIKSEHRGITICIPGDNSCSPCLSNFIVHMNECVKINLFSHYSSLTIVTMYVYERN